MKKTVFALFLLVIVSLGHSAEGELVNSSYYLRTYQSVPCTNWDIYGRCLYRDYMSYSTPEANSLIQILNMYEDRIKELERKLANIENN